MIEKIEYLFPEFDHHDIFKDKINELVDAVNKLEKHKHTIETLTVDYGTSIPYNLETHSTSEPIYTNAEDTLKNLDVTLKGRIKELERQNKALIIEVLASLNNEGVFFSDDTNVNELYRIPQILAECTPVRKVYIPNKEK